jgi:hypothetical protein
MIPSRRSRCTDCAEGFFEGNGRCSKCNGTGVNTQLDSDQPKCPFCKGTGVCATCNGTGYYPSSFDDPDSGDIITLGLE